MTLAKRKILILATVLLLPFQFQAQVDSNRFDALKNQLDLLIVENPGLEEPVDLSVSGIPLAEFIRALGKTNNVNLSVSPDIQGVVVNNFSNVSVSEVLLFLAKQYNLDLKFTGNIIQVEQYRTPPPPPKVFKPRPVSIAYDSLSERVSIELKNDSLPRVAKALTNETGKNVVFQPGLENKLLSVYLRDVQFDQAMDKLAFANDLKISKTADGFYLIEKPTAVKPDGGNKDSRLRFLDVEDIGRARFDLDSNLISIEAMNRPIEEVVSGLFQKLGVDYYFYTRLDGNVSLKAEGVTLDELLAKILANTNYSFKNIGASYLIGERDMEGLREARRISLYNRSVEEISQFIPNNLMEGLQVKEFNELNCLLVSGAQPQILALEDFVRSIDQPVPVVIIEVMIVDYQRNATVSTGIEAGVADEPVESGGKVFPGVDYTLGAGSINDLIESFDGFGSLNLGPVTPNFYVSLKMLENNGVLNVKSTPKLSTLNGHEASISIGNTEYYVVEQTNVTGVQNPIPITTRNYQPIQANFTLNIKPFVSADNQVTLDISVEQSDFTARISPEAPPGSVSRQFTTMIRVRNNEMILLGGLEEKGFDDTGTGFPLLSRIPVIKWLFSSRTKASNKSKLNVFIKPTILN